MRALAAVALLSLSACPPDPGFTRSFLTVQFTGEDGQRFSANPGSAIRLRRLPADCKPLDVFELQNFGAGTVEFELSPPSQHFSYPTGPFQLASGGRLFIEVRIDPTVDLPGDGRLRHEFRIDPIDRRVDSNVYSLGVSVLTPELVPSFDFGAVVVGESARRPFSGEEIRAGAFSTSQGELFFAPTVTGLQTHELVWADRLECTPIRVPIRGDGVSSRLAKPPAPVDFGTVPVGTTAERDLVVSAWTNDLAKFSTNSEGFSVDAAPSRSTAARRDAQGELQPAQHVVKVRFTPSRQTAFAGQVQLQLGSLVTPISVSGTGGP